MGWINDNGRWYFSDASGAMQTGLVQVDGKIYSLDADTGVMQVGDITISGKTYTFAQSGEAIGTNIIPSKIFNSSGVRITGTSTSENNNNKSDTLNTSTTNSSNSSSNHTGSGSNSSDTGSTGDGINTGDSGSIGDNGSIGNSGNTGNGDVNEGIPTNDQAIFPKSQQSDLSFIGDLMPYYEDGKFNIFYLDDIRDSGEIGFHPWSLLETDDFYDYTNEGIVIDHSNSNSDQDLALGTGSVIKDKNGLYHAFFTGFNDRRNGVVSEVNKANLASQRRKH